MPVTIACGDEPDPYALDDASRAVAPRGKLDCPKLDLVRYKGTSLRYHAELVIAPPFAERLSRFEKITRDVAVEIYGRAPTRIHHLGTYSCRRIGGYPELLREHAFGNAIDQAYPSVDYDDLMAGVDSVIGRGYIDTSRMYVAGCSGGGVLSSWVIGHTTRFAGAAVRCPVTNWMSMAGHTDVPLFTHNFFAAPFWEKPDQWLKQSPLMYVGNVKTPTLIMTGNLDLRTPMPQSEEYYAALKLRKVDTAMIRVQDEYHGAARRHPSNQLRRILYVRGWFGKYQTPVEGAAEGSETTSR